MKLLLLLTLMATQPFTYGYMPYDCTLYSDPQLTNALTTLPATYFAVVLDDQSPIGSVKVSYKDIVGYLSPVSIQVVDYEPVTKFASASFTVSNDGYPAKLRAYPKSDSPVISEIPFGTSGYYYGDVSGDALIDKVGPLWHYVSVGSGIGSECGYVYSSQVSVTAFTPNVIEKVEHNDKNEDASSNKDNNSSEFILIACLCVPSVLIMYLLFRDGEPKPRYKD